MKWFFGRGARQGWPQVLSRHYANYTRPAHAYGMTTNNELCLLETFARDRFVGSGKIVDLGCWYGATTLALARGLSANARATRNRRIEAFDYFEWQSWMDPIAAPLHMPRQYGAGEDFHRDVQRLLEPYADVAVVERQDLLSYIPPAEPIELLFVDAMKSWDLADAIVSRFFPLVVPDTGHVVQQDFAYYYPEIATNHLIMWYLRDHFEFVHHVPGSCSVLFRCVRPVGDLPVFTPALFTADMVDAAYAYSCGCVAPEMRPLLEVSRLNFLIEQGRRGEAERQMERLSAGKERFSEPVLNEIRRVIRDAVASAAIPADWGAQVHEWAGSRRGGTSW